ncbi:zinc ABC transporter substrate-binding protein ZnuA [Agarivorans aestuarii]|uniref:High-affinity zinc uptake system protein ZnuA n=1 Tax=Agarivorans aestuarii TaxID=1563703 RepID=A0ABU7G955_9ALTE|nr:zinc ABC transporter substrate-binding protein ZnuA [Agarivorans aestuarii]MEE1675951.1 zinc ABC transporter substrate-binding protein ZnuA [Agarivorans aestuarii]
MRNLLFVLTLIAMPSWATSSNIQVSIKPLQLIISSLSEGEIDVDYLVSPNVSPHDYALRPSDVRALRSAELVFWVGDELEPFLNKPLSQTTATQLALLDIPGLDLIDGDKGHDHDHDHHHDVDPHVWLGPNEAKLIATAMTEQLIKLMPENKAKLEQQLVAFKQRLEQTVNEINQQLKPVQAKGYFVFHDGYSYFEREFGLNRLGEFTINPQRRPGAKSLLHIRQQLEQGKAKCIFAEPQFDGALLDSISQHSGAKISMLDPLGINISSDKNGYFELLHELADSYYECLSH